LRVCETLLLPVRYLRSRLNALAVYLHIADKYHRRTR